MTIAKRTARIVARLTRSEKSFVTQAAKTSRKNITEFVRDAVFKAANDVNTGNGHTKHTPSDVLGEQRA